MGHCSSRRITNHQSLMDNALRVLISIQQRVPQWQIPEGSARALMSRFPGVRFTYAQSEAERAEALASAEVAYTWRLSVAELARAPRLRWVHTSAVAVETLCLPELAARGVRVSNTRGVQAVPIAEHVLAVMFALAKHLPFAIQNQARYLGAGRLWRIASAMAPERSDDRTGRPRQHWPGAGRARLGPRDVRPRDAAPNRCPTGRRRVGGVRAGSTARNARSMRCPRHRGAAHAPH